MSVLNRAWQFLSRRPFQQDLAKLRQNLKSLRQNVKSLRQSLKSLDQRQTEQFRGLFEDLAGLRQDLKSLRSSQRTHLNRLLEEERRSVTKLVREHHKQLEHSWTKQSAAIDDVGEQIRRVERRQEAGLRHQYLDQLQLESPHDLTAQRFREYSQNGEDGLSLAVFKRIGLTTRGRFVDIGCGPIGGNARFFAEEFGWSGLFIDAREHVAGLSGLFPPGQVVSLSMWVSRENVNDVLRQHGLDGDIDLLSIDVDGMDYWLWDGMTASSPRLVIIEYNSFFGPQLTVTVPYEPAFNRKERDRHYYGASLAALVLLGKKKGYRLVAVEPAGVNAYFVRNDLAPELPGFEAHQVFRRYGRHQEQITRGDFNIENLTSENGLPLIDVAEELNDGQALDSSVIVRSALTP